jgi:hypothetical protein
VSIFACTHSIQYPFYYSPFYTYIPPTYSPSHSIIFHSHNQFAFVRGQLLLLTAALSPAPSLGLDVAFCGCYTRCSLLFIILVANLLAIASRLSSATLLMLMEANLMLMEAK